MSAADDQGLLAVRAIVAALTGAFGDGHVHRGRYGLPVEPLPFVAVAGLAEDSEQGPGTRRWSRTSTVDVDVWDACSGGTDAAVAAAEALRVTARDAIEAAFIDAANQLYKLDGFVIRTAALGSDLDAVPDQYARAFLSIELQWSDFA